MYTDWCAAQGIRAVVSVVLPPSLVDELAKEKGVKAYSPTLKQTTKAKKSGPAMAGTKAKAKGKTSAKRKGY